MRIEDIISQADLEILKTMGIVDEIALRDYHIREEFEGLRIERGARFAMYALARRYNLGVHTIDAIVYPRKRTEKHVKA